MIDFGTVRPGETLYIPFHTFDSNDPSASVTITGLATTDIEIYKDGSTTQRASDAGYSLLDTDGIDFDTVTGIHGISIDLADNTTSEFYQSGSQYWVVISSITVDAATVNFIAATFRIGYEDAVLNTAIATLSTQTSFTLDNGPAEDDALNGRMCVIHDVASKVQVGHAIISDYTGSTKTVTLAAATTFTIAAGDNIAVMGLAPLQPTTAGNTLDVTSTGAAGIDWGNIENPTTVVDLSGTDINLVDTTTTNTDMRGTDSALLASSAPTNFSDLAITVTTGQVTVGTNNDKTGYSISGTKTTLDALNDVSAADVNAQCDTALSDIGLDHLLSAAVVGTDVTDNSIFARLVSASATADWDDFVNTTDSLQAIRDRGDAAWTTGGGGSSPILLQNTTIATLASQTSFTLTAGSADDDAYNGMICVITDQATSTQKAVGKISDYTGSTRTVTLKSDPAIFTIAVGDTIDIVAVNDNVTLVDTTTTNTDMRGTDSAATASALATAQADLDIITGADGVNLLSATQASIDAIEADTNELQGDWVNGGRLDLILDAIKAVTDNLPDSGALTTIDSNIDAILVDTGTTIPAQISGLNNLSAAQVNAEVLDVLNTDTFAELSSIPAAATTLTNMIRLLYSLARNKTTQTATTFTLRNDADSGNIGTSTVSDDGTTATKGEMS